MFQAHRARQSYAAIDTSTRTEQASPHRLIELLYDELLSCLRQAVIALGKGDLALKSNRLSKALSVLHGLEAGLDFNRGGEVARSLGNVYGYIRQEVMAANAGNDPVRLAAALESAGEIADAWKQIRP